MAQRSKKTTPKKDIDVTRKPTYKKLKEPVYPATIDGRAVGTPITDVIPQGFTNLIDDDHDVRGVSKDQDKHNIFRMTRTLMPLGVTPDKQFNIGGYKLLFKGLNQAKFNALILGLQKGLPRTTICKTIGITLVTFNKWLELGNQGIEPYTYILAAINEAEMRFEEHIVSAILDHGLDKKRYKKTVVEQVFDSSGALKETRHKTTEEEKAPALSQLQRLLEVRREDYRLTSRVEEPEDTFDSDLENAKLVSNATIQSKEKEDVND